MNRSSLILSLVLGLLAAGARAGTPAGSRQHQLRLEAAFGATGLYQPVVLNLAFDMDESPNSGRERIIRDITFALELLPGGGVAQDPYTLAPSGKGQIYAYAVERKEGVQFVIEIPAHIGVEARRTALRWGVHRAEDGSLYGSDARLMIYPYCSADLSSCFLGTLAGVSLNSNIPELRIESARRFSLVPKN